MRIVRFFVDYPVFTASLSGLLLISIGQPPAGSDFFTTLGGRLSMIGGVLAVIPAGLAYGLSRFIDSPVVSLSCGTAIGLFLALGTDALIRRWRARARRPAADQR